MNLNELHNYITSRDLLVNARSAGHLPVYLYAYSAADEDIFAAGLRGLTSNLMRSGKTVLHIDLFDLVADILKKDGSFDTLLEVEHENEKGEVTDLIENVANVENVLIPRLREEIAREAASILFLSGFGKCYPFLRAKKVVAALEQGLSDTPVVLFFPGSYDGWSLMLFGTMPEHSYRAINLSGQIEIN